MATRTLPQTAQAVKSDPGWRWCQYHRCRQCPGWHTDDAHERAMCYASEVGEQAREAGLGMTDRQERTEAQRGV